MPRRGLDRAQVVDAAGEIADAEGLEAVTLARVAAALGVRSPSLYNHVAGREGLLRGLAAQSTRELAVALRRAATGRAGADAIAAVARRAARVRAARIRGATRPRSRRRPAATPSTSRRRPRRSTCSPRCSGGSGLEGDELIHAARALRSAVHGFAALEAAGGFGLAVDRDDSFRRLVEALAAGIG